MSTAAAHAASPIRGAENIDPHHAALQTRRNQVLLEAGKATLAPNLANGAAIVVMLYSHVDFIWMSIWFTALLTLNIIRRQYFVFNLTKGDKANSAFNRRFYVASAAINGAIWGFCPFLLSSGANQTVYAIVIFIMAGMTAAATANSTSYRETTTAFILPCLSLSGAFFITQYDVQGAKILAILILYFLAAERISKHNQRLLVRSIKNELKMGDAFQQISEQASTLKKLAAEQQMVAEQAQLATKAKSDFLANVSHEIRTPMNGVIGMLTALGGTPLKTEQKEMQSVALQSAQGLLRLINDILDFSKIQSGKLEVINAPFSIRDCVKIIESSLAPAAEQKGIVLNTSIDDRIPDWLSCDETRLRQVLFNLAGNAVKFTDKGKVTLELKHLGAEGNKHAIQVSIIDTGIGISQENLPLLFRRFSQVSSKEKRHAGAGLGLAISAEIVALMGGRIEAESKLGHGSRFTFTLNLTKEDAEIAKPNFSSNQPVNTKAYKLLIAEDNLVNQKVIEALLGPTGHSLTFAEDGQLAVKAASKEKFDCILMDLQMPVMNGLEAASQIRDNSGVNAQTPIIAVTAQTDEETQIATSFAGMQMIIAKPINLHELQKNLAILCASQTEQKIA